jgi:hypothetical protein
MLGCEFFGLMAGAHHLVNLLFHCINTVLLFMVLKRSTGATWRSGFVAALFGWHPLHVESVAWISERKDVVSALFFLLTIWAYVRWVQSATVATHQSPVREPTVPRHRRPVRFYFLAIMLFILGLMSKPMVVTLPFVLLLLDGWPLCRLQRKTAEPSANASQSSGVSAESRTFRPGRASWRRPAGTPLRTLLLEKLPFFALALIAGVVAVWAQKSGEAMRSMTQVPLALRLENAVVGWATYSLKLFWTGAMAIFYPCPDVSLISEVAGAVLLLGAVSWAAVRLAGRAPYLAVGWFWFLGTLTPVIGLVQLGEQGRADRYTYIPSIGLFIAVVWGIAALLSARPWRRAAAVCGGSLALAACLVGTRWQLQYWQDSGTLFEHALEAVPGNYLALNNLGMVLLEQGDAEQAKLCFGKALLLRPDYGDAHRNLGSVLAKEGRFDEARAQYEEVIRLHPRAAAAWDDLGKVYASEQRLDEAVGMFTQALGLDPKFAPAHHDLGLVYGLKGELEKCAASIYG